MKKELVSVIVPAYNAGQLIRETIESIVRQTYKDIEIIVVDDGSTDDTKKHLEPYIREKKIRYIYEENQGQAAARKKGFEVSKGAFISFIDSDDLIAPEKIELQMECFKKNPECDVCYSDIVHFWDHQKDVLLRKKLRYYSGQIFDKLIRENFIQVMTALIRREVLEKYGLPGARFRRSDDWYLWLNLSYHGAEFYFIKKPLAFQRRQSKGTLSDQRTYFEETARTNISIYEHFKKILPVAEIKKYNIDSLLNFWQFRRTLGFIILFNKEEAKKNLRLYRAHTISDAVKKGAVFVLVHALPIRWFGNSIIAVREFTKRRSFEVIKDPGIKLPIVS